MQKSCHVVIILMPDRTKCRLLPDRILQNGRNGMVEVMAATYDPLRYGANQIHWVFSRFDKCRLLRPIAFLLHCQRDPESWCDSSLHVVEADRGPLVRGRQRQARMCMTAPAGRTCRRAQLSMHSPYQEPWTMKGSNSPTNAGRGGQIANLEFERSVKRSASTRNKTSGWYRACKRPQ